ncbi:hypothetical protein LAZ67_1005935 [Cordylochernes scorpioides]|uniref:ATP-dependent DNA helicase n=1 Tax=Cordylochernes scorpioides TaxID=51811 RepID=A0ABY6K1E2_9ARAC|nr:hypothetical protein LAZ67_1005935 [Cordylochernes scorpioides]
MQLLLPRSGSQVVARKVLEYLNTTKDYDKIIIHTFSVGAYLFGELLLQMQSSQDIYATARNKIKGLVMDSSVDVVGLPYGLSRSLSSNPAVIKAVESYATAHLTLFHGLATKHYYAASKAFHDNDLQCPSSSLHHVMIWLDRRRMRETAAELWKEKGNDVTVKVWDCSNHVNHLNNHRHEYSEALSELLNKLALPLLLFVRVWEDHQHSPHVHDCQLIHTSTFATILQKVDRITEDSSMQRMKDTPVVSGAFVWMFLLFALHLDDPVDHLKDAMRGLAVLRTEEIIITPIDSSCAKRTSSSIGLNRQTRFIITDLIEIYNNSDLPSVNLPEFGDIHLLLYADDIAIIGESRMNLQKKIKILKEYLDENLMTLNESKSKIMVFRNGGKPSNKDRWFWNDKSITITSRYTYLGFPLTPTITTTHPANYFKGKALTAINATHPILIKSKAKSINLSTKLFDTIVRAVLMYAAPLWATEHKDLLDSIQDIFIRRFLNLPRYTPGYLIRLETGRISLSVTALKLTLKYWLRVLNMSSDRLPRICFNRTRELSNASGTPIGFIKKLTNLLNNNGYPALVSCDDPETLRSAITGLLKTAADQSIQNDLTRMDKSKLYSHYKDIHISFMTEGYLLGDFPFPVVRLLAQVRILSSFFRENHTKMLCGEDPTCTFCNSKLKNEITHYIFDCPALKEERRTLMLKTGQLCASLPSIIDNMTQNKYIATAFYGFHKSISQKKAKGHGCRDLHCQRLAPGFHRRVKAKTSFQDDNVPIDDEKAALHAARKRTQSLGQRIILPSSFVNSPRYLAEYTQDAFCYVRKFGHPDLFITFTSNPSWEELSAALLPGQKQLDRHDITARVFRQKLVKFIGALTKGQLYGATVAWMYSVEWQKRGLPHAHILVWLANKLRPTQIDSVICAEFPDPIQDPLLYNIVVKNMIHGPCGEYNPVSPCMKNSSCSKKYPKQFLLETQTNENGYPLYRRRAPEAGGFTAKVKIRGREEVTIDNRWVVPYSPLLSKMFCAHINVENCSSVKAIKYICKYVNKGSDQAIINLRREGRGPDPQMSFPLHQRHPAVIHLAVHLENGERIYFNQNTLAHRMRNPPRTTLTAFFSLCQTDSFARTLLYPDVPQYYTWNSSAHEWRRRVQGKLVEGQPGVKRSDTIGRVYAVHVSNFECFCLRMLLHNIKGPTSFAYLKIVNGSQYETFRETCAALGLLENDNHWVVTMDEAVLCQAPTRVRQLFAILISTCTISNPQQLWITYRDEMASDILHRYQLLDSSIRYNDLIYNETLCNIEDRVVSICGKKLQELGLGAPRRNVVTNSDILRELAYDTAELEDNVASMLPKLLPEQIRVFDAVLAKINLSQPIIIFLDAPGGNRTAHSVLKLPLTFAEGQTAVCNIRKNSDKASLLRSCKLLVWDECTMAHKIALEALDRTLQDIRDDPQPMGGLVVLLAGDFRQTLPVVTRDELLKIGEGQLETDSEGNIQFSNTFCQVVESSESLYEKVFPNIGVNYLSEEWLCARTILAPKIALC